MRSSTTRKASPGAPLGDVWDLGIVAPVSKERTGYPTQKPEALLERLVMGLSLPGDLVLDAFAGSGTTLVTAAREGTNLVPAVIAAVEARATLGEISDAMRRVFGEQQDVH